MVCSCRGMGAFDENLSQGAVAVQRTSAAALARALGRWPGVLAEGETGRRPPPHQANFAGLSVGAAGWFLKASGEIVAVGFSGRRYG